MPPTLDDLLADIDRLPLRRQAKLAARLIKRVFVGREQTTAILTAIAQRVPNGRALHINPDGSWRLADADHRPSEQTLA